MADVLILTLDFETPPRADELGELFAALARDYKDLTKGRVLVVSRLETGSLIAHLQDLASAAGPYVNHALEYAKGVKGIADFAKLLRDWFSKAKSGKAKKQLYHRGRKTAGQRSVEKMLDIAASSNSAFWIKLITPEGETIEAELTPPQAIQAKDEALAHQPAKVATQVVPRLTTGLVAVPEVRKAIGSLYDANVANLSASEVQAIIDALISVLQAAGLSYLIDQIATDLANRGMLMLAAELGSRAHRGGTQEPPLTTT